MLTKMSEEFEQRNCKVLAIGVDSKTGHRSFIKDTQVRSLIGRHQGTGPGGPGTN